jgi:hypothetical protein
MLKIGILFIIWSYSFIGTDVEYDPSFLGLLCETVFFSLGQCPVRCYFVTTEGTHFQFFVAVTPGTERVFFGFCTLTI